MNSYRNKNRRNAVRVRDGARSRKLRATGVGLGVAACVVAPFTLLDRGGPASGQEPPWPLPALAGETSDGADWRSESALEGPAALMYATPTCPFCKDELARWSAMIEEGVRANVWVIAAQPPGADVSWIPASMRRRTVADADRSIARALAVRYVPVTYWTDGADTVRVVRVGQSSRTQLAEAMDAVGMPR